MTRLIDDLLSLSRVEMREHLPPARHVDLNETVAHVIQSLQPLAEPGRYHDRVPPAGGARRHSRRPRRDRAGVARTWCRTPSSTASDGGRIERAVVARRRRGGGAAPHVGSPSPTTGPASHPSTCPASPSASTASTWRTSREKGGTGLGLAIVKHILNRHRGELRIASEVGKGLDLRAGVAGADLTRRLDNFPAISINSRVIK